MRRASKLIIAIAVIVASILGILFLTGNNKTAVVLTEGQQDGPLLLQKIYPDRIEGLSFVDYPVARGQGSPIALHIGESVSNGCTVSLKLVKIQDKTATFLKEVTNPGLYGCPICLSGMTLIDTPNGYINVKDLRKGMAVWTTDAGSRKAAIILETVRTSVPQGYQIVHLVLNDGRELFASPGHPMADGRTLGEVLVGDIVDNAVVASANREPYRDAFTYDILPSGESGLYLANGILVKSTLAK